MHYFFSYRADTHTHTDRKKNRKHNLHQEILGGDKNKDNSSVETFFFGKGKMQ